MQRLMGSHAIIAQQSYMQEVSCAAIILYTSARSFSAESNDVSIKIR